MLGLRGWPKLGGHQWSFGFGLEGPLNQARRKWEPPVLRPVSGQGRRGTGSSFRAGHVFFTGGQFRDTTLAPFSPHARPAVGGILAGFKEETMQKKFA